MKFVKLKDRLGRIAEASVPVLTYVGVTAGVLAGGFKLMSLTGVIHKTGDAPILLGGTLIGLLSQFIAIPAIGIVCKALDRPKKPQGPVNSVDDVWDSLHEV